MCVFSIIVVPIVAPIFTDVNIAYQIVTEADSGWWIFGSSYETSGYYTMTHKDIDAAGQSTQVDTGKALDFNNLGNSTNEEGAFEFTLFNPSSNSHFTHYQSKGTTRMHDAAVIFFDSAGIYEATPDIDAIRVLMSSGTISGTFKLYGIK